MVHPDCAADLGRWQAVERLLPANWEQLAVQLGFSSRAKPPPGAVCPAAAIKLRAMLHLVATGMSLRVTAAAFAAADLLSVTHVSIHKWFRRAAPFFSCLLVSLTEANRVFSAARWAGYEVRAIDATTVQRPGATGTTARIHYCLRLNDMACVQCILTTEKVGESLRNFSTAKGVLDIADRGYSNPPSIAAAVDQGGDVLVRWNPPSLPLYDPRGRRYVPRTVTRRLNLGEVAEWPAQVRPGGHDPIDGRLVITRLPAEKATEARARLRREQGAHASAQMLHWAGFIMLFTTVPKERLSAIAIAELYCLRWQIELQFKREKSIGDLDQLPNHLDETVRTWILAKLILSELARRLVAPTSTRSPPTQSLASAWETTVLAWSFIRTAFLSVDWNHLKEFVRRFCAHLTHLKRRDDPRQVATFLAFLGGPDG